jgi:DNA-binding beta-propeller fold protein YncE
MPALTINGITIFDAGASLAGNVATPLATSDVNLIRLGSYVGSGAAAAGRAESVVHDGGRLYVTNASIQAIDVSQINRDGSLTLVTSIALSGLTQIGTVNSVAVRGGIIAVAYDSSTAGSLGYVALFDAATFTLQKSIAVGILPDHLAFSPDGRRLVVANEAEAVSLTANAAGSVSIIDTSSGAASAAVITTIAFTGLNGSEAALRAQGVALLAGQSAANDIEPEYVAISADGTRAYITLQEVNAVAVVDLTNTTATAPLAILPLGVVDHNLAGNAFDPSDQNGISIVNANVLGLLQPDSLATFVVDEVTYFITANEGDARVGSGINESVRLGNAAYVLDPATFPNAAAIKANASLGRLNVFTHVGDTDGDGDFDQIYTLGGRGFTIFRQNADGTISKVRETGGEFEAIIARDRPDLFNTNQATTSAAIASSRDRRGWRTHLRLCNPRTGWRHHDI